MEGGAIGGKAGPNKSSLQAGGDKPSIAEAGETFVAHSFRPELTDILELPRFEEVLDVAEDENAAWALLPQGKP